MSSSRRDFESVCRLIAGYYADEARERLGRIRGGQGVQSAQGFTRTRRFVSAAELRDVLAEARERELLPAAELGAWAALASDILREAALASVRDGLRAHARRRVEGDREGRDFVALVRGLREGPEHAARALALISREASRARGPIEEARHRASELTRAFEPLAASRPDRVTLESEVAMRFLDETDALLHEALDYLVHRGAAPGSLAGALRALFCADLDDAFREDLRREKVMALAEPLGLERELSRRVRLEPWHGGAGLRSSLVALSPPIDLRVSPCAHRGLLGELSFLEGVFRALALALASPALPFAFRQPIEGTVARAFGGLFVRLAFDDARLSRARRTPGAVHEASRRLAATSALLALRVHASSALVPSLGAGDALARALPLNASEDLAALVFASRAHAPRFASGVGALALFSHLRERFDEDFERNPRTQEALRALCERGGSVSIGEVLAERGAEAAAPPALAAWFRGC